MLTRHLLPKAQRHGLCDIVASVLKGAPANATDDAPDECAVLIEQVSKRRVVVVRWRGHRSLPGC